MASDDDQCTMLEILNRLPKSTMSVTLRFPSGWSILWLYSEMAMTKQEVVDIVTNDFRNSTLQEAEQKEYLQEIARVVEEGADCE